jgi:hypothetical protein
LSSSLGSCLDLVLEFESLRLFLHLLLLVFPRLHVLRWISSHRFEVLDGFDNVWHPVLGHLRLRYLLLFAVLNDTLLARVVGRNICGRRSVDGRAEAGSIFSRFELVATFAALLSGIEAERKKTKQHTSKVGPAS